MVGLKDIHFKLTSKSEPGKKEGGRSCHWSITFHWNKKKERMKSYDHPASHSHVEPSAKASKHKLLLWFYTWCRCVFASFHRHSLMYALISTLHSHAKLNILALAVKKKGWIFYRDWHRKSVWYKSFLQITHRSRELLPFHFKAQQSGIFTAKISHLKRNHNWIWDHALPDMAPVPLTQAYQKHPTFQSGFHAISWEYG